MKRALVTGGSGVIGSAICLQLAERGFDVLVHANSREERARALAKKIVEEGGAAEAICFDVSDRTACAESLSALAEARAIQVVVHNAGIHDDAPLAGMTGEQWDSVMAESCF